MKKFFSILALFVATATPFAAIYTQGSPAPEANPSAMMEPSSMGPSMMRPSSMEPSSMEPSMMEPSSEPANLPDEDTCEDVVHTAMINDMKHFVNKVRGKVITVPGSLKKEGMQLKANMFRLLADSLRECGKLNYPKGKLGNKYEQAARKVEAAATALESLPVKESMKMNFKQLDDWLNLKVKKKEFKARFIQEIAKRLGDERMIERAEKYRSKIEKLKSSLTELTAAEETDEEEATETAEEESSEKKKTGCPVKLSEESAESAKEETDEEEND